MTAAARIEFIITCLEECVIDQIEGRYLLENADRWGNDHAHDPEILANEIMMLLAEHGNRLQTETVNNELP